MRLNSQHILVTRAAPQGQELCALLEKHGAITHHVPTVEIQPRILDFNFFESDVAIFLSANAVKYCPPRCFSLSVKYVAIGTATAMALMQRGVNAQQPEISNSEGLLALPDLQQVRGKEIAIYCGVGGRELLYQALNERGAHCQRYEVYQRYCATNGAQRLQNLLETATLDYVICTSGENLLCLEKLAGAKIIQLHKIPLLVISKRIAEIARKRKFSHVLIMDDSFDNKMIVDQLVKWRGKA